MFQKVKWKQLFWYYLQKEFRSRFIVPLKFRIVIAQVKNQSFKGMAGKLRHASLYFSSFFGISFSKSLKTSVQFLITAECATDLDLCKDMIILGSILSTVESSRIFRGSWGGIETWFQSKTKQPSGKLA